MEKAAFLNEIGDRKLFFFDTETTGLYALEKYAPDKIEERNESGETIGFINKKDYVWDDIIEIGYIVVDPRTREVLHSGEHLIKGDKPVSDIIYGITGISQEAVDTKGISKEELYEILRPILDENPILVAYNTKFDITFLHKWLLEIDSEKYKYFNFDVLDVMTIYANYYEFSKEVEVGVNHAGIEVQKKYGHRLVGAMKTVCHRELKQTHRALDDIEETIVVFNALEEQYDVYDFLNVLGYHPSVIELRYFYSLKPYHVAILPLLYNGNDFYHKILEGDIPAGYRRMIIPKWIWTQEFNAGLRKKYWKKRLA